MPRKSISSFILRSIACSLLLLVVAGACAQRSPHRTSKEEQERLRMKQIDDSIPWFRGFQVKADLVGVIEKMASSYGQYEAGVRFNLKDKYFPVVELGYGKADESNVVSGTSIRRRHLMVRLASTSTSSRTSTTSTGSTSVCAMPTPTSRLMSTMRLLPIPCGAVRVRSRHMT